jgi:hypothetical protein
VDPLDAVESDLVLPVTIVGLLSTTRPVPEAEEAVASVAEAAAAAAAGLGVEGEGAAAAAAGVGREEWAVIAAARAVLYSAIAWAWVLAASLTRPWMLASARGEEMPGTWPAMAMASGMVMPEE